MYSGRLVFTQVMDYLPIHTLFNTSASTFATRQVMVPNVNNTTHNMKTPILDMETTPTTFYFLRGHNGTNKLRSKSVPDLHGL